MSSTTEPSGPLRVGAPVPGRVLALAEVPDPVFAGGMVGPGLAVDPERGPVQAVSPVAGRLFKVHPHAFVVLTPDGRGVLVHLGIDTVALKGDGFTRLAAEGDDVRPGDPVVVWDAAEVERGGRAPSCPVVALDADPARVTLTSRRPDAVVAAGDTLFTWT
ncbi:MAG: PTS sugar transporter subunit IIA [Actinomycetes bacterium]